jgi:hypothetical protein
MLCPLIPPDATVNEYYTENITFYLPAEVNDPSSGINATLTQVTITSISGLPYGLEFSFNENDNIFLPSSGENFGCATICGTPIIPGVYQVLIAADVELIALGFASSLQQSFSTSITVVAAEGQTGSFTFDQNAGCGSLNVVYNASFSAPSPAASSVWSNASCPERDHHVAVIPPQGSSTLAGPDRSRSVPFAALVRPCFLSLAGHPEDASGIPVGLGAG